MAEAAKYAVKYLVSRCDPPLTVSEIHLQTGDGDYGAADAVVVHSLLYPEDGSRSEAIVSLDGRTGQPVSDLEQFKCMVSFAHRLSESKELSEGHKLFCKRVFRESVQHAALGARGIEIPVAKTGFIVRVGSEGKDVTELSEAELRRYLATQRQDTMYRWVVALVKWIKENV